MIGEAVAADEFIDIDPVFAQQAIRWMIAGTVFDISGASEDEAAVIADQLASFAIRAMLRNPEDLDRIRSDGVDE